MWDNTTVIQQRERNQDVMTAADQFAEPQLAEWSETYSVGVDDIDNQHRQLFALINELWRAVNDGSKPPQLDRVFRRLEEYTVRHFRDEEKLMAASGYPGCAEHKRTHVRFIRCVAEAKANYHAGQGMAPETMYFFSNWLVNHVQKDDRAAADFYLERLPPQSWFDKIFGRPGPSA